MSSSHQRNVARTLDMRLDSSYASPQQQSQQGHEAARATRYARHTSTSYSVETTYRAADRSYTSDKEGDEAEESIRPPPQTHNFGSGDSEKDSSSPLTLYATSAGGQSFLVAPSPMSSAGNSLRQHRDRTLTPTRSDVGKSPSFNQPQRTDKAFSIFGGQTSPQLTTPTPRRATPERSMSAASSSKSKGSRPPSPAPSGRRGVGDTTPRQATAQGRPGSSTGRSVLSRGSTATPSSAQRELVGAVSASAKECRRLKSFIRIRPLIPNEVAMHQQLLAAAATASSPAGGSPQMGSQSRSPTHSYSSSSSAGGRPMSCVAVGDDGRSIRIADDPPCTLDGVFAPDGDPNALLEAVVVPNIADSLEGHHTSILLYGQTGSGKSFTMHELLPAFVEGLFTLADSTSAEYETTVTMEAQQIYLESISDLLEPSNTDLQIREFPDTGIYVKGAKETKIPSAAAFHELWRAAIANRAVASTKINHFSSRSHCIVTFSIKRRRLVTREQFSVSSINNSTSVANRSLEVPMTTCGKVSFADLAGSERLKKSGSEGTRRHEAIAINQSLSTLGNVMQALADPKSIHIPFRDSKLTRLLQESLAGGGSSCIVTTISPYVGNFHESRSSLAFAMRAMKVIQAITTWREIDGKTRMMETQDWLENRVHILEERLKSIELSKIEQRAADGEDADSDYQDSIAARAQLPLTCPNCSTSAYRVLELENDLAILQKDFSALSSKCDVKVHNLQMSLEFALEEASSLRRQAAQQGSVAADPSNQEAALDSNPLHQRRISDLKAYYEGYVESLQEHLTEAVGERDAAGEEMLLMTAQLTSVRAELAANLRVTGEGDLDLAQEMELNRSLQEQVAQLQLQLEFAVTKPVRVEADTNTSFDTSEALRKFQKETDVRHEALKIASTALERQLTDAMWAKESLEDQVASLTAELESLRRDFVAKGTELSELKATFLQQVNTLTADAAAAQSEANRSRVTVASLESQLVLMKGSARTDTDAAINGLQALRATHEEEMAKAEERHARTMLEARKVNESLLAQLREARDEASSTLATIESEAHVHKADNHRLQRQLASEGRALASAQGELDAIRVQMKEALRQVEETKAQTISLNAELLEARSILAEKATYDIGQLEAQHEEQLRDLEQVHSSNLEAAAQEQARTKSLVAESDRQLKVCQLQIAALQGEIATSNEALASKEVDLASLATTNITLQNQFAALKESIHTDTNASQQKLADALRRSVEEAKAQSLRMQSLQLQHNEEIADIEGRQQAHLMDVEAEMEELRANLRQARADVSAASSATLTKRAQALEAAELAAANLKAELFEVKQELVRATSMHKLAEKQLQSAEQHAHAQLAATVRRASEEAEAQNSRLMKALESHHTELAEAEQRHEGAQATLKASILHLKSEIQAALSERDRLADQLEGAHEKLSTVESAKSESKSQADRRAAQKQAIDELVAKLKEAEELISEHVAGEATLRAQLLDASKAARQKDVEAKAMSNELHSTKSVMADIEGANATLKDQILEAKATISMLQRELVESNAAVNAGARSDNERSILRSKQLAEENADLKQRLSTLNIDSETTISLMKSELVAGEQSNAKALATVTADYQQKIRDMEQKHATKLRQQLADYDSQTEEGVMDYTEKISRLSATIAAFKADQTKQGAQITELKNQLRIAEEEHQSLTAHLERQAALHATERRSLSDQNTQLTIALKEEKTTSEATNTKQGALIADLKTSIANASKAQHVIVDDLTASHDAAIDKLNREHTETLKALKQEYSDCKRLLALRQEESSTLKESLEAIDAELAARRQDVLSAKSELAALQRSHMTIPAAEAQALNAVKEATKLFHLDLEQKISEEVSRQKSLYSAEVSRLVSQHEVILRERMADSDQAHSNKLREHEQRWKAAAELALSNESKDSHAFEEELKVIGNGYSTRLGKLREEHEREIARLSAEYKEDKRGAEEAHQRAVSTLNDALASAKTRTAIAESELAALNLRVLQSESTQVFNHDVPAELEALRIHYQGQLVLMKDQHQQSVEQLKLANEQSLQAMDLTAKGYQRELKQRDAITLQAASRFAEERAQLESLNQQHLASVAGEKAISSTLWQDTIYLNDQLATLEKRLAAQVHHHSSELTERQKQHAAELSISEERIQSQRTQFNTELARVRDTHSKHMEELTLRSQSHLAALQGTIDQLTRQGQETNAEVCRLAEEKSRDREAATILEHKFIAAQQALRQQLAQSEMEVSTVKAHLKIAESSVAVTSAEVAEAQMLTITDKAAQVARDLNMQIERMRSTFDRELGRAQAEYQKSLSHLQHECDTLRAALTKMQSEALSANDETERVKALLEQERFAHKGAMATKERQLASAQSLSAQLRSTIEDAASEAALTNAIAMSHKAFEVKHMSAEIELLKERLTADQVSSKTAMEATEANNSTLISSLRAENVRLGAELAEARRGLIDLKGQQEVSSDRHASITQRLSAELAEAKMISDRNRLNSAELRKVLDEERANGRTPPQLPPLELEQTSVPLLEDPTAPSATQQPAEQLLPKVLPPITPAPRDLTPRKPPTSLEATKKTRTQAIYPTSRRPSSRRTSLHQAEMPDVSPIRALNKPQPLVMEAPYDEPIGMVGTPEAIAAVPPPAARPSSRSLRWAWNGSTSLRSASTRLLGPQMTTVARRSCSAPAHEALLSTSLPLLPPPQPVCCCQVGIQHHHHIYPCPIHIV